MDLTKTIALVEALLMSADEPLDERALRGMLPEAPPERIADALAALAAEYPPHGGRHGVMLARSGAGWRFRTRDDLAPWMARLHRAQPLKLGRAALEALAVVAWRQPVSRAQLEALRGVDCSGVLQTLMERELVRVMGHRQMPGRPALYGTTERFLEVFGLRSLDELPPFEELVAGTAQGQLPWDNDVSPESGDGTEPQ